MGGQYPRTQTGEHFSSSKYPTYVPEDIPAYLADHGRVSPYHTGTDYDKAYVDEAGYQWVAELYVFRRKDEEKSAVTGRFETTEEHPWVAYAIDLTDEQQLELQPFCSCPLHKPSAQLPGYAGCACCVGCVHSAFPSQGYVMAAIRDKATATRGA